MAKRLKIYTKTGDRGTTSLFGGRRVDKNSARIRAYGEVDELNSLIGVILADETFMSLRGAERRSNLSLRHSRFDRESSIRELVSRKLKIDSRFPFDFAQGERGNDRKNIGSDNEKQLDDVKKKLLRIQSELFVLGSDLATPIDVSTLLKLRGASKIPRITKSFIVRLEKEIDAWSNKLPQLRNFIIPGGSAVGSKLHLARTVARRAERSIVDLSADDKINKNAQIYINRLSDWFFTLARLVNQIEDISEIPWKGRSKT